MPFNRETDEVLPGLIVILMLLCLAWLFSGCTGARSAPVTIAQFLEAHPGVKEVEHIRADPAFHGPEALSIVTYKEVLTFGGWNDSATTFRDTKRTYTYHIAYDKDFKVRAYSEVIRER